MRVADLAQRTSFREAARLLCSAMFFAILASGCATPTTGIVPRGDGLFTVTRQGDGFWVTTDSLKAAALIEAGQHCEASKRPIKVIHVKEIPAGAFGRWPEAEILFSCP